MKLFLYSTFIVSALALQAPVAIAKQQCYDGVAITGYYGVLLSDYDMSKTKAISIDDKKYSFNASFLANVAVKTGGITHEGKNLTFWGGAWNFRDEPLDVTYFPKEDDYTTTESVTTVENGKVWKFPKAFVEEVALEGSGKIAENQYLGRPWDLKWHFRKQPLDASERPVEIGVVATVPQFFNKAHPMKVSFKPTPVGFEKNVFWARDLGPAITDKHIDIFSGWGFDDGLMRAVNLTSDNNTVCFGS